MERYKNASTEEKAKFTHFSKIVKELTHLNERSRELKGDKSWVKYILPLSKNNPFIHSLEFGVKKGEVANIRLVVAKTTHKSDWFRKMEKLGFNALYGNIVLHLSCDEKEAITMLAKVNTLSEESEVVELDPKRTYCDPPQGWYRDRTGKEGITKEETTPAEK